MSDRDVVEDVERQLAANLKRLREERAMSQSALAAQMQSWGLPYVRQTTVSRIEKGEQSLRVAEALALTSILEVSLEELVSRDEGDNLASIIRVRYTRMMSRRAYALHELCSMFEERIKLGAMAEDAIAAGRSDDTYVQNAKWFADQDDDALWSDVRSGVERGIAAERARAQKGRSDG